MKKIVMLGLSLCLSTVEAAPEGIGNVIIQGVNHGVQSLGNSLLNSLLLSRYQMAMIGAGIGFFAPKAVKTAQAVYEDPLIILQWIVKHPLSLGVSALWAWKNGYNRAALGLGISSLFFAEVNDRAKNKPHYVNVFYLKSNKPCQQTFAVDGDTLNVNELTQQIAGNTITGLEIGSGIQHIGGSLSFQNLQELTLPEGIQIDQNNLSNANTGLQINASWSVINDNSVLQKMAKRRMSDCGRVQLLQPGDNEPQFNTSNATPLNQQQPTTLEKALNKASNWLITPF